MRSILILILLALAILSGVAGAKDKPEQKEQPGISEAQRTHVRELERDYAKLQVQIIQAQTQQEKLRNEYLMMISAMKGTCTAKEEWNEDSLSCKPKPAPAAEKK